MHMNLYLHVHMCTCISILHEGRCTHMYTCTVHAEHVFTCSSICTGGLLSCGCVYVQNCVQKYKWTYHFTGVSLQIVYCTTKYDIILCLPSFIMYFVYDINISSAITMHFSLSVGEMYMYTSFIYIEGGPLRV